MAYLMHLDAVKTHTRVMVAFIVYSDIEVMGGALGFDELSETHIQVNPTYWAQVGQ